MTLLAPKELVWVGGCEQFVDEFRSDVHGSQGVEQSPSETASYTTFLTLPPPSLFMAGKALLPEPFVLERTEERFHGRVVQTLPRRAEAGHHPVAAQAG